MKVRNGFVSNSSASSFVVLTTKANHDRVMEKLDDYHKAVVNAVSSEVRAFFMDMVVSETSMNQGGDCWEWVDIDFDGEIPKDEYGDDLYKDEAFDEYVKQLEENPEEVFTKRTEVG